MNAKEIERRVKYVMKTKKVRRYVAADCVRRYAKAKGE